MTAVLMAAVLEILGAFSGTAVALTIGKGIVALDLISLSTVVAALMGTMAWSLFTYYLGIPVSETHGLIGAIIGASLAISGARVILWAGVARRFSSVRWGVALDIVLSWILTLPATVALRWAFNRLLGLIFSGTA